jgi:hypothetical protein
MVAPHLAHTDEGSTPMRHLAAFSLALTLFFAACGGGTSLPADRALGSGGSGGAGSGSGDPRTAPVVGAPPGSVLLDTATLGLSASGAYGWITAPADFLRGPQLDMVGTPGSEYSYDRPFPFTRLASNHPLIDWTRAPVSVASLRDGVQLTPAPQLPSGQTALQWKSHPTHPTLMTELVGGPDWSAYGGIYVSVYSAAVTQETITLGVRNDNPATAYLDYWAADIKIDWAGWKEITIPFASFSAIGSPADWKSVDAIHFFSKVKGRSPHPDTELSFERLALVPSASVPPADAPPAAPAAGVELTFDAVPFYVSRNHTHPEVSGNLVPGTGPAAGARLSHLPFFAAARGQNGYHPRFDPGYVSLDPAGRPYVRAATGGGLTIQWLDASGQWQSTDLAAVVQAWAATQNNHGTTWARVEIVDAAGGLVDPTIRFDKDGDAYVLVDYRNTDAGGGAAGTLLLHCKDITHADWHIYNLSRPGPNYFRGLTADFEKIDTYNRDALEHPPVITLSTSTYAVGTNQAAYLLAPIKNADGTLTLPAPVEFTPYGLVGPVHSGGGNFVVSKGNTVYLVYAYMAPSTGPNGAVNPADPTYLARRPPIPANNAANALTVTSGSKVQKASDGVPIFVRAFDRPSGSLSAPVFVGYGGVAMDAHNWPAMALDADGQLQVVMSGHIQPMGYARTTVAGDITTWTDEVYVKGGAAGSTGTTALASYGAISVDKNNALVVTFRSDTGYYNHRLSVITKPARADTWNAEHSIVIPFNDGYHVWNQRLSYDAARHRHYLGYHDQSGQTQLSHDAYQFYRFIWPEAEAKMTGGAAGSNLNEGLPGVDNKVSKLFNTQRADFTVLVSDDGGANWRLGTSADFAAR